MQKSFEISGCNESFLDVMKLAYVALCDQVDNGPADESFSYSGPGVVAQFQPNNHPAVYAVTTGEMLLLTIVGSRIGEAIYLLLDAIDAFGAGVFQPMLTGAVDRLDGETQYMSGYPVVLEWV
jgi:hypothetical protein